MHERDVEREKKVIPLSLKLEFRNGERIGMQVSMILDFIPVQG